MSIRAAQKQQTRQSLLDTALALSFEKGAFASVSLREITTAVGIVPAAFYRHFPDMNALGLELVDCSSIYVRNVFYQMGRMVVDVPESTPIDRITYLFEMVDAYPAMWHFFLAERFSGHLKLREALQREHHYLLHEFTQRIVDLQIIQEVSSQELATSFSTIYLQAAFNWVNLWMNLKQQYQDDALIQQQQQLKACVLQQIYLLFLSVQALKKPD